MSKNIPIFGVLAGIVLLSSPLLRAATVAANQVSELRTVDDSFGREFQADLLFGLLDSTGVFTITATSERTVSDQSPQSYRNEFLAFVEWAQGKTIRRSSPGLTSTELENFSLGESYVVTSGDFEGTYVVITPKTPGGGSPKIDRPLGPAFRQIPKFLRRANKLPRLLAASPRRFQAIAKKLARDVSDVGDYLTLAVANDPIAKKTVPRRLIQALNQAESLLKDAANDPPGTKRDLKLAKAIKKLKLAAK